MRVMVFGATGMLGHKVCQVLVERDHTVIGTMRPSEWPKVGLVLCDAVDYQRVALSVDRISPQVIVNCIGIVPSVLSDDWTMTVVNGVFPWILGAAAKNVRAKLIHISTDCVFSGLDGGTTAHDGEYVEDDCPNGIGRYALTKQVGEVSGTNCLTLRTSFIGPSPYNQHGLLEWVLSKAGSEVEGWTESIFNGLTTLALSRIIADVIENYPEMTGLYHVSGECISKHDLLGLVNSVYNLGITIKPVSTPMCNRALDSRKFFCETNFIPLSWPKMLAEMKEDIP